ncbi:hypothetical protein OG883_24110 [Streptomyces sp. NBC_01142]|uniref:hypothetical protein n=1 Tax=Streptomyces sp. NBC_01142 TaxID=2975865 RepID=UPI00225250C0|nr:hypothetical protein [Streptomyces sp. NBC_01142]MCX4822917.1 hypothetical protein [Streptomyces sp. NBC_01142]
MRTTARLLTGTASAVACTGFAGPGAHAGDSESPEVNPATTQIAAGAAVLAAAAVGGTMLLRRRASGAQGS